MAALTKKIDFVGFIMVERSNPNGDPLNGNQPRTDYNGYGEISDVCLKRKVRNRLQDVGEKILVQLMMAATAFAHALRQIPRWKNH